MARLPEDAPAWRAFKAPTLAEFETLARAELAKLPADFLASCGDLVLRVDDFPSEEVLRSMQINDPFDLMGLFQGIGLPFRSVELSGAMPNMIWLYRRPILDYWAEHDETLGSVITHVLIHEIGHHFGLSDADMEAIEAQVAEA
jgi:predicted Zn-dependent protease with MMP-like domain